MSAPRPFERLSPATLRFAGPDVALPAYERRAVETGIVHLGPGAFHRAHQAFCIDRLLETDRRWGICGVALRGTSAPEALTAQDGLFTIAELSEQPRYRVIGAVREAIAARIYPQAVLARLTSPAVRIVTLTVTENGYCLTPGGDLDTAREEIVHDLAHPDAPVSPIGWLTLGLRRRQRAALAPFTMISCDNLADNGARLKRAVLQFAQARDPDLARWIEGEARFPGTMVDSITPATDEALKARVALHIGAIDQAPVQREPFVQWVMEDVAGGPDWTAAGVTLTHDVAGYEQAKLRILNGAHSTLAYLGLLRQRQTTREAMADAALARFVRELVAKDIAPGLTPPAGLDLAAYSESVLARIANPAITHYLGQIAWDGSQKLPFRLFASIAAALAAGRPLARLAVPVAAWMRFVRRRARDGVELIDPLAPQLSEIGKACTGEGAHDVALFLALGKVFSRDLARDEGFRAALVTAYDLIGDGGDISAI
ncbi:MAG: mannitol dehydrogenase family protein [Rhizomicrobium sp.]